MNATYSKAYYENVSRLLLSRATKSISQKDPEQVLTATLEMVSHFLNMNKGRIFLWDTQTAKLVIRYSHGLTAEQIHVGKYEISEGITGEALGSGNTLVIENVKTDPRYTGKVSSSIPKEKWSKSYIAVPISDAGHDLGVLAVEYNCNNDEDVKQSTLILNKIAAMMAKIIHKYELNDFSVYQAA